MPTSEAGRDVVLTPIVLREWALPHIDGSKDTRGRVLVVGGHVHTPGAVLLAAEAAMRAGAGKLQMVVPESVATLMAVAMPEAMVVGVATDENGDIAAHAAPTILGLAEGAAAVLLGPGVQSPAAANALCEEIIPRLDTTIVIDALGMAYLTEHPDGLAHLFGRAVLSPNLGELATTLGVEKGECEANPAAHVAALAERTGATIISGGGSTWIVSPDGRRWRDETGGPGLGVSGSGDVKAGVIAGLCARRADPEQAASWAAYAHGRAGQRLAARVGTTGYLARELLLEIPRVLAELA